jgi:diguanylate cyclase (GGDEF)-like protein
MTRPVGFLAAIWPANALLLALFIRFPRLANPLGWLSAVLAYLAADLVTGGDILKTFWLTGANVVCVAVGFVTSLSMTNEDRALRRPRSIFLVFCVCLAAASASAVVGGYVAAFLFGHDFITGFSFWFTTEFVNAVIIVPLALTMPPLSKLYDEAFKPRSARALVPLLLVIVSVLAQHAIGGGGFLAFPVPALLLCALTYRLFATALITFLVCGWQLIELAGEHAPFVLRDPMYDNLSLRLGVALIALAPLTVASINAARNDLLENLKRAASYDFLTDALSRSAFVAKATAMLMRLTAEGRPVATLMLDIDRFKRINDKHGHAAGDCVLVAFAAMVREILREGDLFGRIGGEEFAVILSDVDAEQAAGIAERIRAKIASTPIEIGDGRRLRVTVSAGLSFGKKKGRLDRAIAEADAALYRAKELGRNQVVDAADLDVRKRA